jgi:NAD(P)-dependent dehydrogenase (short-subunit alcohol dehydrogenase family)
MSDAGHRFAGRVALVTGASRGIGLAIAERIVSEGGRVCITGRNPEPLQQAVEHLGGPDVALAVAGAADNAEHQQETIQAVQNSFGQLDALVNNTGINPLYGTLLEADSDAMRKILDVNLLAGLAWARRGLEAGLSNGGAIVNIASVAGLRPARGIGPYGASKAALLHLTQQLALELAPDVRVNAVAPAVIRTRFGGPLYEGKETEVATDYPMARIGDPEDVAGAVAYLASNDAAWITGQVLVVDGGLMLTGGI